MCKSSKIKNFLRGKSLTLSRSMRISNNNKSVNSLRGRYKIKNFVRGRNLRGGSKNLINGRSKNLYLGLRGVRRVP